MQVGDIQRPSNTQLIDVMTAQATDRQGSRSVWAWSATARWSRSQVTPELADVDGQMIGRVGVTIELRSEPQSLGASLVGGVKLVWVSIEDSFSSIGRVFGPKGSGGSPAWCSPTPSASPTTRSASWASVSRSGAVSSNGGWDVIFYLFGFVTVFIGLINLLPLPPFDGGHLAMLGIEKLRGGRPVDMRKVIPVSAVVMAFFVTFVMATVFLDITKPISPYQSSLAIARGCHDFSTCAGGVPPHHGATIAAMSEQTVLVVDDEEAIAEAVRARLESEGYRVLVAADGPQAIEQHTEHHPDLVVLDLMLPGMDGLEVCQQIQRDGWTPVLMLTAKTEEADKVAGFAVGADDYLTKPFSLRELASRVKAILRRMERMRAPQDDGPLDRGGLVIDATRRRLTVDGDEINLTPLEFEILLTLARDPGRGHVARSTDGPGLGLPRLRRWTGGRLPRRPHPPQAARGRQRATVHPYRARRGVRLPGILVKQGSP